MDTIMNDAVLNTLPAVTVTDTVITLMDALTASRSALSESATSDKLNVQGYADAITAIFGKAWYENTDVRKGVKAERELFKRAMVDRSHDEKIERVYWLRVKKAAGYETNGMKVKGAETLDQKTMAGLKTIINRIIAEEDSDEGIAESGQVSSNVKGSLMDIFVELGGDKLTLGAKV
jgi:hypothetical protein